MIYILIALIVILFAVVVYQTRIIHQNNRLIAKTGEIMEKQGKHKNVLQDEVERLTDELDALQKESIKYVGQVLSLSEEIRLNHILIETLSLGRHPLLRDGDDNTHDHPPLFAIK